MTDLLPRFHAIEDPDASGAIISFAWNSDGLRVYGEATEAPSVAKLESLVGDGEDWIGQYRWTIQADRRWWHTVSMEIAADPYGTAAEFALENWRCAFCNTTLLAVQGGKNGACPPCAEQAPVEGLQRMAEVMYERDQQLKAIFAKATQA